MDVEEKIQLLQEYGELSVLSNKQYDKLAEFSVDDDEMIRSMVAPLLIDFINEASKDVLLRLAQDKSELVRIEALDSLSCFPYIDVLDFLEKRSQFEPCNLARSYAILSWADVLILLRSVTCDTIKTAQHRKEVEQQVDCKLCWCYALYVLGNTTVFEELLQFLNDDDYQVRCTTLSLLSDIIEPLNESKISEAVKSLLIVENSNVVRERAEYFFEKLLSQ